MRQQNSIIGHIDWPLFITFLLMMGMGLATVYSVAFDVEHPNIFDFSQVFTQLLMSKT